MSTLLPNSKKGREGGAQHMAASVDQLIGYAEGRDNLKFNTH